MTASEFLDRLEQEGLLPEKLIAVLRQQVAKTTSRVTGPSIAKLLVEKGHLTSFQAQKLLDTAASATRPAGEDVAPEQPPPPTPDKQEEVWELEDDQEETGLAALDDEDHALDDAGIATSEEEEMELTPLSDEPAGGLSPLDDIEELTSLDDSASAAVGISGAAPSADLDDLMEDPLLAEAAAGAGTALMPTKPKKKGLAGLLAGLTGGEAGPKGVKTSQWDSPLLLVGGGALLALIIIGVTLFLFLYRGSGDDMFKLAEDDYRAGSYGQAISKYEKFLSKYPNHPKASSARVRTGLAKLWQAETTDDWQRALTTARQVLPVIEKEDAFAEARPELASLLPDIMAGFAEQARAAEDSATAQSLVDLAHEALDLVNNSSYLPTSQRKGQQSRIDAIMADLDAVKRNIDRDHELAAALEQINEAIEKAETARAYAIRQALLKKYPTLDINDQLQEAVRAVAAKEREKVALVDTPQTAETEDHPVVPQFRVILAHRRGASATGVANQVVYLLVEGAVYGLEAASGRPLWRRFVGFETTFHPLPLTRQAGSDALVVDGRRNELLRLTAQTGELVWRLTFDEPLLDPVMVGDAIFVATRAGRLLVVDPESGAATRQASFPQGLSAGPGADGNRPLLYLPGEHSSLYALSADTLECQEVAYVGHGHGSVVVPPVIAGGRVIVANNAGLDHALLHVLAADANGQSLEQTTGPVRLPGQIVVRPIVFGRYVIAVTNRGSIHVFEVDPGDPATPLREIAKTLATAKQPMVRYCLLDQGRLWVGDQRLTKYEVQTSREQVVRKWINDEDDIFLGPPQIYGNVLFHVRRPQGAAGASVSAIRIDDRNTAADGKRIWETDLGVPTAGEVFVNTAAKQILAVSAGADLFAVDSTALRAGVSDRPVESTGGEQALPVLQSQVELADGRRLFCGKSSASPCVLYDPASGSTALRVVRLAADQDSRLGEPVVLGRGVLAASNAGPVYWLDAQSGQSLGHPFQPGLRPGVEIDWQRPAVLGEDNGEFVIADGDGTLYHIGAEKQPQTRLVSRGTTELEAEVVAPLAAIGDTAYLVIRGATGDAILPVGLPDLEAGRELPFEGRVIWGPHRVGEVVLVASDADELVCLAAGGQQRWNVQLDYGPPVGRPLLVENDILMASASGTVWRVAGDTGSESARLDVGQPLGNGPVTFGSRLLISARDGTLLVIGMPG